MISYLKQMNVVTVSDFCHTLPDIALVSIDMPVKEVNGVIIGADDSTYSNVFYGTVGELKKSDNPDYGVYIGDIALDISDYAIKHIECDCGNVYTEITLEPYRVKRVYGSLYEDLCRIQDCDEVAKAYASEEADADVSY